MKKKILAVISAFMAVFMSRINYRQAAIRSFRLTASPYSETTPGTAVVAQSTSYHTKKADI